MLLISATGQAIKSSCFHSSFHTSTYLSICLSLPVCPAWFFSSLLFSFPSRMSFFSCSYGHISFPAFLTCLIFLPPLFIFLSFSFVSLFVYLYFLISDRIAREGWRVRWRRDGRVRVEELEKYPSLSSLYSKHFTGNCCRRATDRQKGGQANTHRHTYHSLHLYCFLLKSGLHHWTEKENTRRSKTFLPFLSHGWHLSD